MQNDFLTNRKQRLILNCQCSSSGDISAGVSQKPVLIFIHVNGLGNGLKSECKLFADDNFFILLTS